MVCFPAGDPRKKRVPRDQVRQGLSRAMSAAVEEALSECRLQLHVRRSS